MITVALDEQGDFENLKNKLETEPVFIGGVVYDDNGVTADYRREKDRLEKYLKYVCDKVGGQYPNDLHYHKTETGDNSAMVRNVKNCFGNTIEEFLTKGTWEGSDMGIAARTGRYYIFVNLRGEKGKENLLSPHISQAVREDYASNLYIHMAEDVVERILFHNPVIEQFDMVRLDLATRRVILEGIERTTRMEEYERLGFVPVQRDSSTSGVTEYQLTNPSNYRTAVEREMIRSGRNKLKIDRIGVKSIFYDSPKKNMVFLYLADAICSYISFNRTGHSPSDWIESFEKSASKINGNVNNLIWGYDEADDYFDKSYRALENGDYFEALSFCFDGIKCQSSMRDFYCRKWYPIISDRLTKDVDPIQLSIAIKKYKAAIMSNNINQEKMVFIYEVLEKAGESIDFSNKKDEAQLYDLYDVGVSAYTHVGDSANARKCFEKTEKYAEYVATEVFLRTRNRMVVFLSDMLQFEEALKIADYNVDYHNFLLDMKRCLFKNDKYESLNHAITLSQRGQVYSFLCDERAEKDYLDALEIMDSDTPDRLITESYLLHYYISAKDKEKYAKLAQEYFGGKADLIEQFNYLVREGVKVNPRFSLKFALFVYIKALHELYLDELPRVLIRKLKGIENALTTISKKAEKQINGHPWEITYKYLSLIMIRYGETDAAIKYKEKIAEFADNYMGIIKNISEEGLGIVRSALGETGDIPERRFTYMYS